MTQRAMRLALLIDADNILARHAEAILEELAAHGEPTVRRVYGDWSSQALSAWKEKARALGLVMHQQSANTKGKNASDIGLVIDAMDILHAGKVDGFVLVSSDSDFTRLASRIREDGLTVIGVGEAKTPASLRQVCNRFLLIENIMAEKAAEEPSRPAPAVARPSMPEGKGVPQDALPLILEAMKSIDPEGDWYSLGQVGQFLLRLYPDFDPRSFGCGKLSDLVTKLPRFEVNKTDGGNLFLRDRS